MRVKNKTESLYLVLVLLMSHHLPTQALVGTVDSQESCSQVESSPYHLFREIEEKEHFIRTKQAAEKGDNAQAMYELSQLYYSGLGVQREAREGFHWLKKAAGKGFVDAEYKLATVYDQGSSPLKARDYGKAVQMYKNASRSGSLRAKLVLGGYYLTARGGTTFDDINPATALEWYNKAIAATEGSTDEEEMSIRKYAQLGAGRATEQLRQEKKAAEEKKRLEEGNGDSLTLNVGGCSIYKAKLGESIDSIDARVKGSAIKQHGIEAAKQCREKDFRLFTIGKSLSGRDDGCVASRRGPDTGWKCFCVKRQVHCSNK